MEDDQTCISILSLICATLRKLVRLASYRETSSQATDKWQILSGDVTHTHDCLTARRTGLTWKYNRNRTWQFLEPFGPIVEKRVSDPGARVYL